MKNTPDTLINTAVLIKNIGKSNLKNNVYFLPPVTGTCTSL